ncbi:PAS domain-containing protein [Roseiarcaceae bacterium H3SJ34-1]|uniref:PAS domain-containing protein n=1 Tax=Terripilifer ovatus TaxID=3032367 RepID=UPI003AB985AF|nr:PAS domain-containing protein [Roseiarcaceae bacterium H3SJ34-1]
MKQAATRELYNYWNDLRQQRAAPNRIDLNPTAIRGVLSNTFMVEVDAGRSYPLRIVGSRMTALFRRELNTEAFMGLWVRDDRRLMMQIIQTVLDEPIPAVVGITAAPPARAPIELELLLLPLRHEGKTHSRMLGSLVPASIPSWYGIIGVEALQVETSRFIHDRISVDGARHMIGSAAETARRRAHLVVLDGGR